uniref:hypothetical protein n=1 Tax=Ruminococcus bromii TaxID=40518 RepID=UPI004028E271
MLIIINCILALILFFVFFIMLHSEPSFIKLAIVLTALLINIVCVVTTISSFKYTIDIKLSDESADEKATENPLTFEPLLSLRISGTGEKYKIYVPEGSITDEFSIDME